MDADLLALMQSTVQIAPWTGSDGTGYAKPTYGANVTYTCRISLRDEYVRSHDGREILAKGKVYLATTVTSITVRDRLTLPAGYTPANPPILDVQLEWDEVGVNHVVLIIG